MKYKDIIFKISKSENISEETLIKNIKSFEKYIKSEIKKYDDISGLEDFKMNKYDYNILYELYNKTTYSPLKIYILLLYIRTFFKIR